MTGETKNEVINGGETRSENRIVKCVGDTGGMNELVKSATRQTDGWRFLMQITDDC